MAVKQTAGKPAKRLTGAAAKGAGPGRPKGSQNKTTRQVKDMVLKALDQAGGVAFLKRCALDPKTRGAFLTLVGKAMPLQLTGPNDGPIQIAAAIVAARKRAGGP